ncbi:MAG TPA: hypothetical protein PKE45_03320, partial [Caldilineaceae bacterium]|nr:hypothetical protein [Caldilineaceae bacterium]
MNLLPPDVLKQTQMATSEQTAQIQQSTQGRSPEPPALTVAGEVLSAMPQAEAEALIATKDSLQAALWERELALSEASARIEQLTMSISLLTGYSSELALMLEQRNQEYQIAVQRLAAVLAHQPEKSAATEEQRLALAGFALLPPGAGQAPASTGDGFQSLMTQVESLKSDLQASQQSKADLQQILSQRDSAMSELIAAVGPLQTRMEEIAQEKANLEAQLGQRNAELADLQRRLATRQQDLDTLAAASAEADQLKQQLAAAQTERDQATATAADLDARLATRLVELNEGQIQLTTLQAEKEAWQSEQASFAQIKTDLETQAQARASDLAELNNQLAALTASKDESDQAISAKDAELAALQEQFATTKADLETQLQEHHAALDALIFQLNIAQSEQAAAVSTKTSLEDQLTLRTAALEELQPQFTTLQTQIETTIADNAALQSQLSSSESELADLRSQLEAIQANLDATTGEKETLTAQVQANESELADLRSQLETLKGERETLT